MESYASNHTVQGLTIGSITSLDNYSNRTTFFPQGVNVITTPLKIQGDDDMYENLFNVIVVDTNKEILLDKKVVASSQDNAKFVSGLYDLLKEKGLTLDDVTVFTTGIGSVKVKNEK